MLGSSYDGDGAASGNVQYIAGLPGTIVDGFSLNYLYNAGPDKYVDILSADGGALVFESQDSKGRVVCYAGPSDNYRTINSAVVFGALRDGTTTKNELMGIYMDYLTGAITGIESPDQITAPGLSVQNPCYGSISINLSLPSPGDISITVYDTAGRLAGEIEESYYSEGSHSIELNGIGQLATGTYLILLQTGEHTVSNKLIVL